MKAATFAMKTGLVPVTTISPKTTDLQQIAAELARMQQEAPALFNGMPCLIDLAGFSVDAIDLAALVGHLQQHGLLVAGLRNGGALWADLARELKLADFGQSGRSQTPAVEQADPPRSLKVHRGNIRSGQQLYWDGDLIVQGMVSAGAEVLATGDIQIQGALRGRALAGIKGNHRSIVSCLQFDAELVAIAGQYQLFDGEHPERGNPVVVQLEDEHLRINGQ